MPLPETTLPKEYFFNRHPAVTLVIACSALLGLLLLAVEVTLAHTSATANEAQSAARAAVKRYIRLKEHPPFSRIAFTPTDQQMSEADSLTRREYWLTADRDGFVEPSATHAEPQVKVVFLGGSSTECFFMAPEERFPYLVGRRLEKALGVPVNSYNGGVSGNHTMHANLILAAKVAPMRPDVVVLMEAINDLNIMLLTGSYWNENPYRSLIESGGPVVGWPNGIKMVLRAMLPHTYDALWRAKIRVEQIAIGNTGAAAPDEFAAVRGKTLAINSAHLLKNYRMSLVTFVQISRAWGIKPVLMTQASRIIEEPDPVVAYTFRKLEEQNGVKYATYRELYVAFNQIARDVARDLKVPLIDLARAIPPQSEFIYDSVHYNPQGSALAATLIATKLAEVLRESMR